MTPFSNDEEDFTEAEKAGLKQAFRNLEQAAQARMGAHLPVADLERYYYKQLEPESMDQARTHLVSCGDCASWLLDFAAFNEPVRENKAVVEPASVPSFLVRVQAFFFRPQVAYALVAILTLALMVGLLWVSSLRRQKSELLARVNQPVSGNESAERALAEATRKIEDVQQQRDAEHSRAAQLEARNAQLEAEKQSSRNNTNSRSSNAAAIINVPILQLPKITRSGSESTPVFDVPSNTSIFTLVIPDPAPDKTYNDYEIEIRELDGYTVVRENGLRFSNVLNSKALTLAIPTRSVPNGQYRFTVYGISNGRRTIKNEQTIQVRYK